MAETTNRKPWGDAFALVPGPTRKDVWVNLGAVWENSDGSLALTMTSEPLAWRNPEVERRVQIRIRKQDAPGARRARGDQGPPDDDPDYEPEPPAGYRG